jgi:predicted transposase YbfD/YdcC
MKNASTKRVVNLIKKSNGTRKIKRVAAAFSAVVKEIDDPRVRTDSIWYPLDEILFIALSATISGAESYPDFEAFGKAQLKWLKKFFPCKHGIPSHDTFRRVFNLLDPKSFEKAYRLFIESLKIRTTKHIAIDGKASRGCYNIKGQCLLHVVSAFDTENEISLGQIATKNDEGKDVGEYNTIPLVLDQIDVEGTLVTIDAAGCYTEIVDAVVENKASYLITLKDNQPKLIEEAREVFSEVESKEFEGVASYRESARGHGRIEERVYYALPVPEDSPSRKKWTNLETFVMAISYRTVKGETSREVRLMISDLASDQIVRLGRSARAHWGIENKLHWVLDVSFGEDGNRTREGHGAENLSILRRLVVGLMRKIKGKQTVPNMMFRAALDPDFRTKVVEQICGNKN